MKIIKLMVAAMNAVDLNTEAKNFLKRLADNVAIFANPPAALGASRAILNTKLEEKASLEAQVISKGIEVEDAAAVVRKDMNDMGDWCEGVTEDPAQLSKVAPLRSDRTPAGPTPRVTGLDLTHSDAAGHVDAGWNSLYKSGVKSYEVQTMVNPLNNDPNTGTWVQQPTVTKSSCTVSGFASGSRIWARVRAIGPNGPGEWSDPATSIVP